MVLARDAQNAADSDKPRRFPRKLWPIIKNGLMLAFLGLVAWLLFNYAREVNWQEVKQALGNYSTASIATGATLALGTYLAYSSFDLLGRYYVKHGLSRRKTMLIAFICCAFTLNLGAFIGSIGFRYKMYSQRGVGGGDISRIVGLSLTTNWMGYVFLAGIVFATGNILIPADWTIDSFWLRLLGVAFLAVTGAYFALCWFAGGRTWSIRGYDIPLPTTGIGLLQLGASMAHWLLMCSVIYTFLHGEVGFITLLGILLVSAIAGVLAHVPGGLGVLEAVFIALLGDQVAPSSLIAALIAYRAVYYLWPLSLAVLAYFGLEVARKRRKHRSEA